MLLLPAVLLLSALLSLHFFNAFREREMAAVRDSAAVVAELLDRGVTGGLSDYVSGGEPRVTVIAPDGTVLLDSLTDADTLENHAGRPEIADALGSGTGEAIRFSETQRADTFYRAVRLEDGNVLRLSKTVGSIAGVFTATLPSAALVTLLVLLAARWGAARLTGRIVKPLGEIDFEGENAAVYEELAPYRNKIEEQKQEIAAQIAALRARAETIEAITENMREGLILLDPHGTVLSANRAVSELFGDISRQNILHVCRDERFRQGVKRGLSGLREEIEFARNGRRYSVYFSPVRGETHGAAVLFLDMTERHEAEKQRREFSANVSHELKTPLTSISALAEMIGNGMARDEDIRGFAVKISGQAARLIDVIGDIIKLSEFDEGRTGPDRERFELYALAETVVNALGENEKGVELHLTGQRFDMLANRRMMDELLSNLVENGVKYNRDGGAVTVALSRGNSLCRIAVSDTGIGIPPEHQSRVFERFYRVDPSRSHKTGGTGLGLSIVKHIAEHHGGRVELDSSEGQGTTVTCWIPSGL
jgi:two-component system phosphate regulon sensor histidine kinase PhoR